ncbi:thiol reductant ABC exporter subunit CydD [Amycolatopsis sp. NPDC021455]|uniref:thiol reductant ABC exporter subunit CydD n=1 Tax=Amycolatopsis sp. NPDC021455 TaxID=3154901 RepID=UPI0033DA427D
MTRPRRPDLTPPVPSLRRHRRLLVLGALAQAGLILAQAELLARTLAGLTTALLAPLAAVLAGRALLGWGRRVHADRVAAAVEAALREAVLREAADGTHRRGGAVVTLLTKGVEAVEPYFAGYLPELAVAAVVPPAVLARLFVADWASALVILVTLPLIPVFGALVGKHVKTATEARWAALRGLGAHLRDVLAGLPTLRAFGREVFQTGVVRALAEAHRAATVRVLRTAFLSALVLELVASVSVALVAVPVGLRLLDGSLALGTALVVLLLAPEAYLPLRALGARFHASAEGLAVLDEVRELTGTSRPPATAVAPSGPGHVVFENVTVEYPGRPAALREVSFELRPGETVALAGPSGSGKSTVLAVLLGFTRPAAGRVLVDGRDLADVLDADRDAWLRRIAWVPQRAHLFAGTLAENIALGVPEAEETAIEAAAEAAALTPVAAALPAGFATALGERGEGLSAGQRQRVALARAYFRCAREDVPLVLLDEPTARLDNATEQTVIQAARTLTAGRGALVVAHRPALLKVADRVLWLDDGALTERREVTV